MHSTLQERGFAVVALSGEHSQSERNQALQAMRDRRVRVCVATDVAARGIDLPTLSLVIHVEMPRDAETLQHRSGRTGRAGKKGTAVLVVPYPRRKRVQAMLSHAKIKADWIDAPSPDAIRKQDRERLLTTLLEPKEYDEEDRALAERLMAEKSPQDIAAALVSAHRAAMPEPEELIENTPEARRAAQKERHRPGFEDIVWYRMNIGRAQNADPRWILPLLCRRGHITRNEIGAIRIAARETHFQVPRAIADKFSSALERTAGADGDEESVLIEVSNEGPAQGPRVHRKRGNGGPRSDGPPRRNGGGGHRGQGGKKKAGKRAAAGDRPQSRKKHSSHPGNHAVNKGKKRSKPRSDG